MGDGELSISYSCGGPTDPLPLDVVDVSRVTKSHIPIDDGLEMSECCSNLP